MILAMLCAVLLVAVAVFHLFLFLGFPLGAYSYGGRYEGSLPRDKRWLSLVSMMVLILFAIVMILHVRGAAYTTWVLWAFTIFMGLNTLGNLFSKSRKEKVLMTPITAVLFVSCLVILLSS
ncbi:hypothetical protein [Halobacillus salinus]|uniref:hypothetical protein n=1 Tax=Halobacillus salinus TaxID=192814 RepID=UPI0009A734F9|nr:hypothetical protein [Halobacillus salinus]